MPRGWGSEGDARAWERGSRLGSRREPAEVVQ